MAKTIFDRLHLASVTDGDWRVHDLYGLSRLSPYLSIGSSQLEQVQVTGYYNCPDLGQFRVVVREIRPQPPAIDKSTIRDECVTGDGGEAQSAFDKLDSSLRRGTPDWNKRLACPNLFDLDTRNLYFGQLNQAPEHTYYKVGQESKPPWNDTKVLEGKEEPGPEGRSVKGMPVRLQQVHFKAYSPDHWGQLHAGDSQEFAAYFLASNPVGPIPCTVPGTPPALTINSDFQFQRLGGALYWTFNRWTVDGSEDSAKIDWNKRLVIGQPDAATELFNILTDALSRGGGLRDKHGRPAGDTERCEPRIVTHVYATQFGLKYNYVQFYKGSKPNDCPTWAAGIEDIIDFTNCLADESSSSSLYLPSCESPSHSSCPSYEPTSLIPSGADVLGGGQIGCPRDYCPGMEPTEATAADVD